MSETAVPGEGISLNAFSTRERVKANVDLLSEPQVQVVDGFVSALLRPIEQSITPGSWLVTSPWADAFSARLAAHHALSTEPISSRQFEDAFNATSASDEWRVEPNASPIQRFTDTTIAKAGVVRRLSLKASSARDMTRDHVHISKLTEAAWIQDTRRQADRRGELVSLFRDYRTACDGIVMLRGFLLADQRISYQLVEIPTLLFGPVGALTVEQAQPSTIYIPPGLPRASADFAIRVDRSDAKITLTRIKLSACVLHGEWIVEPTADDQ